MEVSKKVLKVLVPQGASKFYHVKSFDSIFLCIKVEQKLCCVDIEVEVHIVPHFNAQVNGKVEL